MKQLRPVFRTALAALFLIMLFSYAAQAAARDDGWELALDRSVPGKGGWTTCYTFASNLQNRFTLAGGESHLVIYDWTDQFNFHNRHAILVYRDADGHYWGVDNRSEKPRWLVGTTPQEWAASWEQASGVSVHLLADMTNQNLIGHTADKTRLALAIDKKKGLNSPTS